MFRNTSYFLSQGFRGSSLGMFHLFPCRVQADHTSEYFSEGFKGRRRNWMSSQSDGDVHQRTDNCGSSWSAVMLGSKSGALLGFRVWGLGFRV